MAKAKDLVIVESPAKAKTIEKYLGGDYKVKASMGHLRDLPKSKMGVDIEHGFEPQYIPVRDKKELIAELKKDAKSVCTVSLPEDGSVPLFLQWDERWGYRSYGGDFLAVTGCGPTALSMV